MKMASLTPPQVTGIQATQQEFDRYQNQAFPARVPEFFALELAGECGELANLEKKLWRDPSRSDCLEKLGDEAADVFISLLNYCNSRNISLESCVKDKLERIEQRRTAGLMGQVR
jgi:NTP pyrophosphatase (non-canonical NTP hydrolase)